MKWFNSEYIGLLRQLAPLLRLRWKYAAVAALAMLINVSLQLPLPLLTRYLLDEILPARDLRLLSWIALLMLGILIVRLFMGFIGSLCLAIFRERVLLDMQMRVFEHVEHLSLSYYDHAKTGQLMSRIMNDGRNLEGLMAESILDHATKSVGF